MHKKIKFSLDYSDNITTIMTPHVINVKSADPDYQDDLVYEVVLKFSKGYLSRNFIEDFNQDYLDVTELDFSFIEDNKDAFSPIDSETKIYQYTTENTSTHSKKLDFQDAENVAQVLRDNIGIKKISFRGQNIGDEGAYYILKALYNNPKNKVTELDFRGCGITDVTLVILYNFLIDKNSNLKLTNISIDSSFNRSLSFKIINKALNKDDLSGEEEFFMHIDDDRANPFYYIKLLDEKYNLKALSHDNYNLIITNQFLLKGLSQILGQLFTNLTKIIIR